MTTFKKKIVGISLAAAMALGGATVVAAPASADSFGGYITHCSDYKKVTTSGTKATNKTIKMLGPGINFLDSGTYFGKVERRGNASSGYWTVNGNGATLGKGFCS